MEESFHTYINKDDINIYINSLLSNVLKRYDKMNQGVKDINRDSIFNLNEYNINESESDLDIDWKGEGLNKNINEQNFENKIDTDQDNNIFKDDIELNDNEPKCGETNDNINKYDIINLDQQENEIIFCDQNKSIRISPKPDLNEEINKSISKEVSKPLSTKSIKNKCDDINDMKTSCINDLNSVINTSNISNDSKKGQIEKIKNNLTPKEIIKKNNSSNSNHKNLIQNNKHISEIIKPEERKNITILFRNYLPARPKTEYKYLKENSCLSFNSKNFTDKYPLTHFGNFTDKIYSKNKKMINMMQDKKNPYSPYWSNSILSREFQLSLNVKKFRNGVPIIKLTKKKDEFPPINFNMTPLKPNNDEFNTNKKDFFKIRKDILEETQENENSIDNSLIQYPEIISYLK